MNFVNLFVNLLMLKKNSPDRKNWNLTLTNSFQRHF